MSAEYNLASDRAPAGRDRVGYWICQSLVALPAATVVLTVVPFMNQTDRAGPSGRPR
jgi:hypothetical protein